MWKKKQNKKLWNRIMCIRIFPPLSKSSVLGLSAGKTEVNIGRPLDFNSSTSWPLRWSYFLAESLKPQHQVFKLCKELQFHSCWTHGRAKLTPSLQKSPKSVANSEFSLSAQSSIIKFSIAVETLRLWSLALKSPLFCLTFALFDLRLAI